MKQRMISTEFWSDDFIVNLDPLERYLFLYLLTNEHTNITGIYKLSMKVMARETGLDANDFLPKFIKRLSGKVEYKDGWIIMINFTKHQNKNSPKVKIGISNALIGVPKEVLEYAVSIGYGYGIDTIPQSESKSESKSESELKEVPASGKDEINEIMNLFYEINPALSFGRKPERDSVSSMIKKYGFDGTVQMVKSALAIQGEPYAPVVTTPEEMWKKLTKIAIFIKGKRPNQIRQA